MKTLRIGGVATLAVLLTACPGDDRRVDDPAVMDTPGVMQPDTPGVARDAGMAQAHVNLSSVGDATATGQAHLRQVGPNETEVHVTLSNVRETGQHHGHIHAGTCDQPGAVVAPLESITTAAQGTGQSTSRVELPLSVVQDGNHLIGYHRAGGTADSPGPIIVCGEIR
jgi:hypothetical protein